MTVKVLTINHFKEAVKMTTLKDKVGGTEPNPAINEALYHYFFPNQKALAVGYFDNNELITWCTLRFGKQDDMDMWIITTLWTKKFTQLMNFSRPDMGLLLQACFDIAEKRHYWNYFYMIADRVSAVYWRQWQRNPYMVTGRYENHHYLSIPARTKPELNLAWRLMGETLKPDDMSLKYRTLRPEFRQRYLELSDYEKDQHPFSLEEVQAKF
jgi:hypothetical protein